MRSFRFAPRSTRSQTEKQTQKIIYSRTRRTLPAKSLPKNGTGPTRVSEQHFPHRGHANTNSGRQSRGSTTFTVTGISSAPARRWKVSAQKESNRLVISPKRQWSCPNVCGQKNRRQSVERLGAAVRG